MQYDEHKLVEYFADAPAGVGFSDLDLNNIPHHISVSYTHLTLPTILRV